MPFGKNVRCIFRSLLVVLGVVGQGLEAQADRQWLTVAASNAANPNTQVTLPRVVEDAIGGRSALVSWQSSATETSMLVGTMDTAKPLAKIKIVAGSAPVVTYPNIRSGYTVGAYRPRAIVRTPSGVIFAAFNVAREGYWVGHGVNSGPPTQLYDASVFYKGFILVSVDGGETFDGFGRIVGSISVCYDASDAIVDCVTEGPCDEYDPYSGECISYREIPNPAVVRTVVTNTYSSINNAGSLGIYLNGSSGSLGYAISVSGPGIPTNEIVEFVDTTSAATYSSSGAITISQSGLTRYFGIKEIFRDTRTPYLVNDGAGHNFPRLDGNMPSSGFGEPVVAVSGSRLGNVLTYQFAWCQWGIAYDGRPNDLRTSGYSTPFLGIGDWAAWGNLQPRGDGMSLVAILTNSGDLWHLSGNFGGWLAGGYNGVDHRREKVVSTYDNSGFVVREFKARYTPAIENSPYNIGQWAGGTWSTVVDGVYGFRGGVSNFTGGSANLPPKVAGGTGYDENDSSFYQNPQDVYAGFSGFMAVVSPIAKNGKAQVYVTETKPAPWFSFAANSYPTVLDAGPLMDRVMVTGAESLSFASSVATRTEWNGRLVGIGQDSWISGNPSRSILSLFVVPSSSTIAAVVDGQQVPETVVVGCSTVLRATSVSGEPGARYYYVWQRKNGDGTWPMTLTLATFQGSGVFDSTGHASIPEYTVSSNGVYRLVVAGAIGGMIYDSNAGGYGAVSSQVLDVTVVTALSVTPSATKGCANGMLMVSASGVPSGKESTVTWWQTLDSVTTQLPVPNGVNAVVTLPNVLTAKTITISAKLGSCAVTGGTSILVIPAPTFIANGAVSASSCASSTFSITFYRHVSAAQGTTVRYSLVGGGNSVDMTFAGGATEEVVGASMALDGTITLVGDLSVVTAASAMRIQADMSGSCGNTVGQSIWSVTVTPPAAWETQPQVLATPWISGFTSTNTMTAALAAGGQWVTWDWRYQANAANPASDALVITGAGPWAGRLTFADTRQTSFRPSYFAPSANLVPNGSFESAPSLGTIITLNNGAAGLSQDTIPGVATLANSSATVGAFTKNQGNRSLRVSSNGLLRVGATNSGLVEVSADSANLNPAEASQSATTAWLALATFKANTTGPSVQWRLECFGANQVTSLGFVNMDAAPVLLSATKWTTSGYIIKPQGGTQAVVLPTGAAYFRPVLDITGTTGGASYFNVDDLRVIPISAEEEALLRGGNGLSVSKIVDPTIHTFLGVDATGQNTGALRLVRDYFAVPTQISACGTAPDPSSVVQATSESRLVITRSPNTAGMTWDGSVWVAKACQGQSLALSASAASGSSMTWEWEMSPDGSGWSVVSGSNSSTLVVPTDTPQTVYYRASVSSIHSNANQERKASNPIKVIVTPTLSGVTSATGTTLVMSGTAPSPLTVSFTGGGEPTIQWETEPTGSGSWSTISGATSSSYAPPARTVSGSSIIGYDHRVTVTPDASCGSAVQVAAATVGWVPAVTTGNITSPFSPVVCSGNGGSDYQMTILTEGVGATSTLLSQTSVSVLWEYRVNSGSWIGTTQPAGGDGSSTYYLPAAVLVSGGAATLVVDVRATVTGLLVLPGGGTTTATVTTPVYTIAINPNVTIAAHPQSVGPVCSGTTATLNVNATGQGITYQWQELSPESGSTWKDLSGANSDTYTAPVLASPVALNPDPSFESGISEVTKIAGTGTFAVDGTTIAAHGAQSLYTSGGPLTVATPATVTVPVTTSNYYLVLASVYSDSSNQKATLGFNCFDAAGNQILAQGAGDLVLFRPIPQAKGVNVRPGGPGWVTVGGIVRGEGPLTGAANEQATFRTGTVAVQVVASLEENGGTGSAHLDNVRLIRLSQEEASLLLSLGDSDVAGFAQARFGSNSDGIGTRAFQYRARIGNPNACGGSALYTQIGVVTGTPKAVFVTMPDDMTICAGQGPGVLTVNLAGASGASLQWQTSPDGVSSWLPVVGQTSAALSIADVNATSGQIVKYYRLQVISSCGVLVSRAIKVTVNPTSGFTQQIAAPSQVCDGQQIAMTVGVQAGAVQWEVQNQDYSWSAIPGATSATYNMVFVLVDPSVGETRSYRVKNLTSCGTSYSSPISVSIVPATIIKAQAAAIQSVCSGQNASFYVTANGMGLTYAWASSTTATGPWQPIAAANGGDLPVYSVSQSITGNSPQTFYYRVTVSGTCGTPLVSQVFSLIVSPVLSIVTPPADSSDCSGATRILSVSANGTGLSYVWTETSPEGDTVTLPSTGASISVPILASAPSLTTDASFERGLSGVARLSGAPSSTFTLDGTNPAAHGNFSIRTSGGEIQLRLGGMIPVETARTYMLMGNLSSPQVGTQATIGFECFDANLNSLGQAGAADIRTYRTVAEATGISLTTSWQTYGGLIGGNEGVWNGGVTGPTPFRVGTAFVRIIASLSEGSLTAVSGLDNVRLVPVSNTEAALLAARPVGVGLAQYFEARVGKDSTGQSNRTFRYTVSVDSTGGCTASTSATANVTSRPAVYFVSQPVDAKLCYGNQATLDTSITASGSPTITWQRSTDSIAWQPVNNSNSPSLTIVAPATGTTTTVWYYRMDVVSDCGVVSSRVTKVEIIPAPTFTKAITNQIIASWQTVSFAPVVDSHGTDLEYQWSTSTDNVVWDEINGATALNYVTPILTAPDGLSTASVSFRIQIKGIDSCGQIVSPVSVVTIYPTIHASISPVTGTQMCSNTPASLLLDVTSGVIKTYAWETSADGGTTWKTLVGQTTSAATVPNPGTGASTLKVRARLSDAAGQSLTTAVMDLTWVAQAAFSSQPVSSLAIASGQTAALSATVNANGNPLVYQWESSTDNIAWSQVSGATGLNLTTPVLTAPNGTSPVQQFFRLQVSGGNCGPMTSAVTTVTIYPPFAGTVRAIESLPVCSTTNVHVETVLTSGVVKTRAWETSTDGGTTWKVLAGQSGDTALVSPGSLTSLQVRELVTDAAGQSYTTPAVTLTWTKAAMFTTQPASTTTYSGQTVTLAPEVAANGNTMTFQWEVSTDGSSWSQVAGGTNLTLTTPVLTVADGFTSAYRYYRLQAEGGVCGTLTSSVAVVTIYPTIKADIQPVDANPGCSGNKITVQANVTSGVSPILKWQRLLNGVWTDQQTYGNFGVIDTAYGLNPTTGQVRAVFTDAAGQVVTTPAYTLTWMPRPVITQQPTNATICHGASATFKVAYQGMAGTVGNWEMSADNNIWSSVIVNGAPLADTTLQVSNATATAYYRYRVNINGCTDTISVAAILTVKPLLSIIQNPIDSYTTCNGSEVNLTVQADGATLYAWEVNTGNGWTTISGANSPTFRFTAQNNGTAPVQVQYRVRVSGDCGQPQVSTTSTITVRPSISISGQPKSVDVCLNSVASASVGVKGGVLGTDYTIQWQMDRGDGLGWVLVPGGTSPNLVIPTGTVSSYMLRAVAVSLCGEIPSDPATIKVSGPTQISTQPQSATACEGAGVSLTVQASGAALSYRWDRSLDSGQTWQAVGGSSPTLAVIATATAQYRVVVFGNGGCNDQVVSSVVTVTVNKLPQEVPIKAPTFSIIGKKVYLAVVNNGAVYDTVTWSFQGQAATGQSVVFDCPTEPGTYRVNVTAASGNCQSASVWNLDVVRQGTGDSDQNAVINGVDLARLEAAFGTQAGEPGYDGACDLNGDGVIDQADEDLLIARFGGNAQSSGLVTASLMGLPKGVPGEVVRLRRREFPDAA